MKKKFILLFIALLFPFMFIYAEDDMLLTTIPNDFDIFAVENAGGSEFKADINVEEEKDVDGIYFVAGNNIKLSGTDEYGIFAGNVLNINSNIEKELFIAGNNVTFDGNVGRDSYIAASNANISGSFGRNVKIAAGEVTLKNFVIDGDIVIHSSKITLGENVTINGVLTYDDTAEISGLETAQVLEKKVNHIDVEEEKESIWPNILVFVSETLALLITAYVINWAFPKIYKKLNKDLNGELVLNKGLIGLGILIVVPICCLFAIFTEIGAAIAIITLLLYGILCYVGKLTILSIIGNKLSSLCFNNKENIYLSIFIGVLLYKLVTLIPYVGDLVVFLALIIGFGYVKELLFPKKEK